MQYAKINTNNVVLKYPYTLQDLYSDNPHTEYDDRFDLLGWFNETEAHTIREEQLVPVEVQTISAIDLTQQKPVFATEPTLVDGSWVLAYTLVEKTAEEKTAFNTAPSGAAAT